MIVRTWSARATPDGAAAYRAYFETTLLPELRELAGFAGGYLLAREAAERPDRVVELTTHTLWESAEAIRAFAGDAMDRSVVEPEARAVLIDFDPTVVHRDVLIDVPMDVDAAPADTREARFERGLQTLDRIDGAIGRRVVESLADVSPELGHQIVAWAFGEMYQRPDLAPRDRQLVTLGVLTALGGCEPQLEVHINAALNVGLAPPQIVEALLHAAVYCGLPRAINATTVAKKVFAERGLLPVHPPATPH